MKCNKCIQNIKCEDCGEVIPGNWNITQIPPYTVSPINNTFDPCMHKNCIGCRNKTCNGVHMISCPCKKCSPSC